MRSRQLRLALYSHDTVGIGHMRRNLLIAQTMASSSVPATMLVVAGAREACAFSLPPRTDCLTMPSYHKEPNGQYQSRHLDIVFDDLVAIRAKTIAAALEAFAPDVLLVDKVPRGACRELEPALEALHLEGRTRCVLGLRDVLDDAATVWREWSDGANEDAIADYYDAVWVYGDPAVYDQVREYEYPAQVAGKVRYTGYLTRPRRTKFAEIDGAELLPAGARAQDRLFLCMVGGGQDGARLAETFAQVDFFPGTSGVILTGPFMPPEVQQRLRRLAASRPRLCVLSFVTDPDLLLSLADRVVAMGGYNTVCELLAYEKHALIVPRIEPRREQLIRAGRLRDLGLVDMLQPDELTPRSLADWLAGERPPPSQVHGCINLNGTTNLPRLLEEVIASPLSEPESRRPERRIQYVAR
jgi:predicted glycosyltransferase